MKKLISSALLLSIFCVMGSCYAAQDKKEEIVEPVKIETAYPAYNLKEAPFHLYLTVDIFNDENDENEDEYFDCPVLQTPPKK